VRAADGIWAGHWSRQLVKKLGKDNVTQTVEHLHEHFEADKDPA
jgi:hypothetical protein